MRLFIDTGSVSEVQEIAPWGVLSGATTNPTLLAGAAPEAGGDGDPGDAIRRICELIGGPVSAEVVSDDPREMVRQGRALRTLHEDVVVKVPFGAAGLQATRELTADGHPVNMTLVFSPTQALLSAEAGASYVSCFMGRLDDISVDSSQVVGEIVDALRPAGVTSQVLAASIRHPIHAVQAAQLGCEVATVPAKVLRAMLEHPLTASGIKRFADDWASEPRFAQWLGELVDGQPVGASR